jgi:hypothetical protein
MEYQWLSGSGSKTYHGIAEHKGKIELIEKQFSVVMRKLEQSHTDESRERFQGALVKLEEELDMLVLPN